MRKYEGKDNFWDHENSVFIAALFTVAETWKQLKCPSLGNRIEM